MTCPIKHMPQNGEIFNRSSHYLSLYTKKNTHFNYTCCFIFTN